ncbi:luciferase domain-containing protein [Streptomyces sp. NPDC055085]
MEKRDVDLHLTQAATHRLYPELSQAGAVVLIPGSGWVTVRLDGDDDVSQLASLTSVALKSHAAVWPPTAATSCSRCPAESLPLR